MASKFEARFAAASLREAKQAFSFIAKSVDPVEREALGGVFTTARNSIQDGFRNAGIALRDKIRTNAASGGAPRRLYSGSRPAIFAFADFEAAKGEKKKSGALVGVRTGLSSAAPDRRLYIQWGAGARRRKGGSIAAKGLSMSLGALFEKGTQDRRIRPIRYFRSAVFATRARLAQMLTQAYYRAAAHINRNK